MFLTLSMILNLILRFIFGELGIAAEYFEGDSSILPIFIINTKCY
jgi:hypothetical protein